MPFSTPGTPSRCRKPRTSRLPATHATRPVSPCQGEGEAGLMHPRGCTAIPGGMVFLPTTELPKTDWPTPIIDAGRADLFPTFLGIPVFLVLVVTAVRDSVRGNGSVVMTATNAGLRAVPFRSGPWHQRSGRSGRRHFRRESPGSCSRDDDPATHVAGSPRPGQAIPRAGLEPGDIRRGVSGGFCHCVLGP